MKDLLKYLHIFVKNCDISGNSQKREPTDFFTSFSYIRI